MIWGLHLLPGRTCAQATPGCLRACLNTAGHGSYPNVQQARARKSRMFWDNPLNFVEVLKEDIRLAIQKSERKGLEPAFRLNLTSDIPWECFGIPQEYPNIQFFDYSKNHNRCPPDNYHLTFSRSESLINHENARRWLERGGNVAVVFRRALPEMYWDTPVICGDNDDLRFLDPSPRIVGLKAKGKAKNDTTNFVVD